MQMNVAGGERQSTANAFLAPAQRLNRSSPGCWRSVLLDSTRAVGVEVTRESKTAQVMARREVILAAGSSAPDAAAARASARRCWGKPALCPWWICPGSAPICRTHLVYFQYRCTQSITLNGRLNPLSKA